jgi:hypothetical protein
MKHIPITLENTPAPITFEKVPKVKGQKMKSSHMKFHHIDKLLFMRRAQRATEASGIKVSMAEILKTAYFQQYPEDKEESDRLKKEANSARKHIDCVKRS